MASSTIARSAHSASGRSGVRGNRSRGTACRGVESEYMVPQGPVSTKVTAMYVPKREHPRDPDERLGRWILGGVVLVAVGVGIWLWQRNKNGDETPPVAEQPVATAGPKIKNPIETPAGTDASLSATDEAAKLVGADKFQAMFVPDDFVRKVVATVDNLARPKVASRMNPAKPPEGIFANAGGGSDAVLGAANYERYAPWSRWWIRSMRRRRSNCIAGFIRSSRRRTRASAIPMATSRPRDRGARSPDRGAGRARHDRTDPPESALRVCRSGARSGVGGTKTPAAYGPAMLLASR